MRLQLLIGILVLCTMGCEFTNPLHPPIINSARFIPDAFDSYRRNTSLQYTLRKRASVSIWITNSQGEQVIELLKDMEETKGLHSHSWLGIDETGKFAKPGVYTGWVKADYDLASATVEIFHY